MPVHPLVSSEAALRLVREGSSRPPGTLSARELPPVAASWTDTARMPVGSWKDLHPVYERHVAPCAAACPVGNDIEGFLGKLRQGDVDGAARALLSENPLPAVCGRVCFHPCESACNRGGLDGSVTVRAIERWLGDWSLENPMRVVREPSGSSESPQRQARASNRAAAPARQPREVSRDAHVAVLGSGPAGLACAWGLRLIGHRVTVFESRPLPGGLLRYGIPAYRLPKNVLDCELRRLEQLGVGFRCGVRTLDLEALRRDHDALFVATGAALGQSLGIEGGAACIGALDFLAAVAAGAAPPVGTRCVVIGGGNAAIDAARSATRLGACVSIAYRRTRVEMPAFPEEVAAALDEGVELVELAIPVAITAEGSRGLRCVRARLGAPDASGRPVPVAVPGSEFVLPADTIVNAIGERVDHESLALGEELRRALESVDAWGATTAEGIFAGGDFAGNPRTVAHALGSGKRAAVAIDRYVQSQLIHVPDAGLDSSRGAPAHLVGPTSLHPPGGDRVGALDAGAIDPRAELEALRVAGGPASMAAYLWNERADVVGSKVATVSFTGLNTSYFARSSREVPARLPLEPGCRDFDEIETGFDAPTALRAAGRCFDCGRCTSCGNCVVFCPEGAVRRDPVSRKFVIHEAHCKGCGICVEECPRCAIRMRPVGSAAAP
jgi:NADPH-dependent glutamate synthase beta subunit-like oxidoreductase